MTKGSADDSHTVAPVIFIPEVRDYLRINSELIALLDQGHTQIRLEGAEGQRLLAAGLSGPWQATIEVVGRTGPEFAANLDAGGIQIIAHGSSLDGAGRGLRSGLILINGDVGDGLGYAQSGGILVVTGSAGHRAGLAQSGGTLAILGATGRLAGDRQSGGYCFSGPGGLGDFPGRGRSGGDLIAWSDPLTPTQSAAWRDLLDRVQPWLDPAQLVRA